MKKLDPKVRVYRNLHLHGVVYSMQARGRVIGHAENILLKNARFIVQKGGQAKVRETKSKIVHAFVDGEIITDPKEMGLMIKKINNANNTAYYNPYTTNTFVDKDGRELFEASLVLLTSVGGKSKLQIV